MQTPPCPACGTPLRPFPEMNAWGCDRCRQMIPAGPAPMQGGGMRAAPGQRTQAEKTRTLILLGALIVAVIGVGIMLATDDKGGGDEEEAPAVEATGESTDVEAPAKPADPAAKPETPPKADTPPPAAGGAATTPKGAPINIPECAEVAALRARVEACAAIPDNVRTLLYQDADNKMSVFDVAPPSGDYAEMVRSKCAGTARSLTQSLAEHSCK